MATSQGPKGPGGEVLFQLHVPDTGGSFVCSRPADKVYLLTFTCGVDNRLTTPFCQTFSLALDILEHRYDPGVLITTSGVSKFYSNGLDLDHVWANPGFFKTTMYPLWHRILTFPRPTVALINGHAFAGGFLIAMMHDYRIMNPHKGYLCMNERDLGAPLRPPMASIFRQKCSPQTFRKIVLEAYRFKALDALKEGLVDSLGGLDETLALIDEFQLVGKAQKGVSGKVVVGELKREMWGETVRNLERWTEDDFIWQQNDVTLSREKAAREARVQDWEKAKSKSKL